MSALTPQLYVQDKVREGQLELVWSYILDYENSANPFEERRTAIGEWKPKAVIKKGQDISDVKIVDPPTFVREVRL